MFTSIKTKILAAVLVLFALGITVMTVISSSNVKDKTEESVLQASGTLVNEVNASIVNYLTQFKNGLAQLSASPTLKNFTDETAETALDEEFNYFLDLRKDVTSVYFATPAKEMIVRPAAELGADYDPTSREWYTIAAADPQAVKWSKPYIDEGTGEPVITASKAVVQNGTTVGVIGLDIQLARLSAKAVESEVGYGGYITILDAEGNVLAHPVQTGDNWMGLDFVAAMYEEGNETGIAHYTYDKVDYVNVYSTVPEFGWKVYSVFNAKDINALANNLRNSMVLIALVTMAVIFIVLFIMITRTLQPIEQLKRLMGAVTDGDLTVRSDIRTQDEIGELGKNFNTMLENMNGIIKVVNESSQNVRLSSESLSAVSEETSASSSEVAHAVGEIAEGASQSAENSETVSERANLLGDKINEITDKATNMSAIAVKTGEMNTNGQGQMQQLKTSFGDWETNLQTMSTVIGALEEKVGAIGSVMNTITEISSQTNLLALNASIEAARAGEHGKGFAVVAEEVRKLAEQSAQSTDEVQATVRELQAESRAVTEQMAETIENFQRQGTVVHDTETTFGDISSMMGEMQDAIESVYEEIRLIASLKDDVSETIQTMAATSQETAAAAEEVSASTEEQLRAIESVTNSAERLTELSEKLTNAVNQFRV